MVFTVLEWTSRCFSVVERKSTNTRIRSFSFLVAESPWTSIKQNQTLTTHNANRHYRVRFYTLVRQPLSKQLYNQSLDNVRQDVKWTMCFVPLDLRVSLNFAHICEQLFKANKKKKGRVGGLVHHRLPPYSLILLEKSITTVWYVRSKSKTKETSWKGLILDHLIRNTERNPLSLAGYGK